MSLTENIPYEALEIGQKVTVTRTIEERDVLLFAAVSGDCNPLHLDPEFAAKTLFREPIAHGMLSGALISAAVACNLPGPGTLYVDQTMTFEKPVKLGDTLTVEIEVLEKLPKFRVSLATRVFNQHGDKVVDGVAKVVAPRKPVQVQQVELPPVTVG
ncbi:MaoC family dehydratase [Pseudomonas sp. SORGH_AS_0199]|uniref:MaoC family dehydratase n=1 Tax=Pseudomonas sp. SORGH_AS_0199 TaxID=3041761 RepID=UPI00286C59BE|nr:MaoC family dehydratase [Pseudomonas sp. SORGH_AS_0199]